MTRILKDKWPMAVLFDLDGTLVETHIDFALMRSEMVRLAREFNIWDEAMPKMDILAIIDTTVERLEDLQKTNEAVAVRQQAFQILTDIEIGHAETAVEIPGARKLLASLKAADISTGIVTRNCRIASLLSMKVVGIDVDVIVTREDTNKHKPLPEPVMIALNKLDHKPEQSVMIGDHPMDVQSGKSAGCYTVGFSKEDRHNGFFDAYCPDLVITSLGELCFAANDIHS